MNQVTITLDAANIQDIIDQSGANVLAKQMLTPLFNQLMEKQRFGEFSTTVFEKYQRSEKALIAFMLEMHIQGVSTRKVSKIVESLCGEKVVRTIPSEASALWLIGLILLDIH